MKFAKNQYSQRTNCPTPLLPDMVVEFLYKDSNPIDFNGIILIVVTKIPCWSCKGPSKQTIL